MRRSSIWFLIAALWLIDTVLTATRATPRNALLPGGIALAFAAVGILQRSRESKTRGQALR
jgi:hypothetical protein